MLSQIYAVAYPPEGIEGVFTIYISSLPSATITGITFTSTTLPSFQVWVTTLTVASSPVVLVAVKLKVFPTYHPSVLSRDAQAVLNSPIHSTPMGAPTL